MLEPFDLREKIQHRVRIAFALVMTTMLAVFGAAVALAQSSQPASLPDVDGGAMGDLLVKSFQSHSWTLVIASGTMLAIWVLGKFGALKAVNPKYIPWISIGGTTIAAVCTALIAHAPVMNALAAGVEAGLAAVGTWEAAGQHVLTFGPSKS